MIQINNLGETYSSNMDNNRKTNSERRITNDDRAALRRASAKRKQLKAVEESLEEEKRIIVAKGNTNHLARKHGLSEPDNTEALSHDRYHCYVCARLLDKPDAYKELDEEMQGVFGEDKDIRTICCFCFDDVELDKKIIPSNMSTKNIRMLVYNPVEAVRMGLDMIESIERKLRRYPASVKLIGTIRHTSLDDELSNETSILSGYSTRYNYAGN